MNCPEHLRIHTLSTEDDSPDLSDHEVDHAVVTVDSNQLAQLLGEALVPSSASVGTGGAQYAIARHEVRRRRPHLYLRSYLVCAGEAEKVLLHRVDWLEGAS